MKQIIFAFILFLFSLPVRISAQGMMGQFNATPSPDAASEQSTAQDEAKGKVIYDKLQSNQTTCQKLTDDDFDVLGDYYMGQRLGSTATHAVMNTMMTRMMGEAGEKQMHISLGKRLSGCDTSAPISVQGSNFLPMMGLDGMMGGNGYNSSWGMMGNFGNNPMAFLGYGSGSAMMIFWLIVGILVIAAIVIWFTGMRKNTDTKALSILKERYAKGEITKNEFDQMKKGIN